MRVLESSRDCELSMYMSSHKYTYGRAVMWQTHPQVRCIIQAWVWYVSVAHTLCRLASVFYLLREHDI